MEFGTKAIHAGIKPDPTTGAIMTPIFQTSTYVQAAPGDHKGYEYARTQNPTRTVLQENLAALENGKYGICFGSGLAAMDAVLKLLEPGQEIIASDDLYGGSYRLMKTIFERYNIPVHFVDMENEQAVEALLNDQTRLLWIETPTNPMLKIIDIQKMVSLARAKSNNVIICVDNTFASPYLQNPLDEGVDLVLHSATKYIGGHSDLVLGAIICKDEALADRLAYIQNAAGAVPGPMDCFLALRGIKTLHVRMEASCQNAAQIAQFLLHHPKISKVYYPGFESHPNHAIAARQMRHFGGMVSFDLKDDNLEAATAVLSKTHLFKLAESLGGVESLIGHPASMTHASIPREERLKVGLTDSLIRLSVGIEHISDLIADLEQALG